MIRQAVPAGLLFVDDALTIGESVTVEVPAVDPSNIGFFLVPDGFRENEALFTNHSTAEISEGLRVDLEGGVVYFNDAELSGKDNPAYFSDVVINGDGREHVAVQEGAVTFVEHTHPSGKDVVPEITIDVAFAPNDDDGGVHDGDSLDGGAGDDLLIGGLGDDYLTGGLGADRYEVGWGLDIIDNFDDSLEAAVDVLAFTNGEKAEDLWFQQKDDDLLITRLGSGADGSVSGVRVEGWYATDGSAEAHRHLAIEAGGETLTDASVQKLVEAMAGFEASMPGFDPRTARPTAGESDAAGLTALLDSEWTG